MRRILTLLRSRLASKPVVAVLASLLVVALGFGGGAAYAYWSSGGAGSGTASTGQPLDVHVIPATGTPTNTLIPGGTSNLTLTLNNPNTYSVTIVGVASNGSGRDAGGGCTAGNSGVSVPTQTGLSVTVTSGASVAVTIVNGASMSTSSDSSCQGKTFELPVLLTVRR